MLTKSKATNKPKAKEEETVGDTVEVKYDDVSTAAATRSIIPNTNMELVDDSCLILIDRDSNGVDGSVPKSRMAKLPTGVREATGVKVLTPRTREIHEYAGTLNANLMTSKLKYSPPITASA